VVCVNCHRRRTARRSGSWRYRLGEARFTGLQPTVARNLRHVLRILEGAECQDCAEADVVVLDFDHVGPKRASVISRAFAPCGLDVLKTEIAECEIRCANCHKKRTASLRGLYRRAAQPEECPRPDSNRRASA
jgi:hypothetical protein